MTADELTALEQPATLTWLRHHRHLDPTALAFGRGPRDCQLPAPRRALAEQLRCRAKAAARLPSWHGQDLLYTPQGLEQCASEVAARWRAGRLPEHTLVADLACGLGVDLAWAGTSRTVVGGWERDPIMARITAGNFARLGLAAAVTAGDGLATDLPPDTIALLDPDRRASGSRSLDPARWSPSLDQIQARNLERFCLKLPPGLDPRRLPAGLAEGLTWLSVGAELKELVAWRGLGRSGRHAVLLDQSGAFEVAEDPHGTLALIHQPDPVLVLPDPALSRAGLVCAAAGRCHCRALEPSAAVLFAPEVKAPLPGRHLRLHAHGHYRPRRARREIGPLADRLQVVVRGLDLTAETVGRAIGRPNGGNLHLVVAPGVDGRPWWFLGES